MATTLEYAQLASHVYSRPDENRTPLGRSWEEISRREDDTWGFSASAYRRGAEIVISFAGTNESADWSSNILAGAGLGAYQITEALDFVLGLMALNPGATFSMTGHSLGGGLASVMAVFLDLQAVVFDAAPFELTARNPVVLQALNAYMVICGYNNAAFSNYVLTSGAQFGFREPNIASYSIASEVLGYIRNEVTGIYGNSFEIPVGTPPISEAAPGSSMIALHSMDLLSSVLRSTDFNAGLVAQNRAFKIFCDPNLYAADSRQNRADFMARMHGTHIIGSAIGGNGVLDCLGLDLMRIGVEGTAYLRLVNEGVLAALAEYYYFSTESEPLSFVDVLSGGIQIDLDEIPMDSDRKGQGRLLYNIGEWLKDSIDSLPDFRETQRLSLQSGSEGLSVVLEGEERDLILGGAGADYVEGGGGGDLIFGVAGMDTLQGGGGDDKVYGGAEKDVLYGDSGNDELQGGDGGDELYGGSGRDILEGGEGADSLIGGGEYDLYITNSQDIINDEDGLGKVLLEGFGILTGGVRKSTDPQNVYVGRGLTYFLDGTTLWVGGLKIEGFNNDDLGIHLETIPDDPPPPAGPEMGPAELRTSPIIIDLDRDGVETRALRYDVSFDHDANGMREATAWAGADDGLLVRDLDGNGRIDTGRELFGTNTLLQNGQLAANGYEALKECDSNLDGIVNAYDSAFSQLRIWRDANSNGVTDPGELLSFGQAGITGVGTRWTASSIVDVNGQLHAQVGTAIRADGTTAATSDVWFQVDATHRINSLPLAENWRDVLELPDAKAYGNLPDLHQAMASDPVLKGLVEAFVAEQDPLQRDAMLEGLIFQWAGVANVASDSRDPTRVYGHVMDARQLIVLETLSGRGYEGTWCWGERDPNPHGNAAPLLIAEFKKFEGFFRAQMLAQMDPTSYSFIRGGFSSGYSKPLVNWTQFQSVMDALHGVGDEVKLAEIIEVLRGLGTYSEQFRIERDQAFATLLIHHPDLGSSFDLSSRYGTVFNDTIFGGDGDQVILADHGNDLVFGGHGNDNYFYRAGDGKDRIYDSSGIDQLVFMEGITASDITVTRDLTSIILNISTGGRAGEVRIDNVFDENGNLREGVIESVRLNDGTVWSLHDVLSQIPTAITSGDDSVYGTTGNDTIAALDGNDLLLGLGGSDVLNGEDGNDTLVGGNGDDTLSGGAGTDILNGGAGNDTYLFALGFGQDVIENYDDLMHRLDKVEFAADISVGDVTAKRAGNDLLLLLASGDSLTVAHHFEGDGVSQFSINQVQFADGTIWDTSILKAKALEGTAGNDTLVGFASDDVVTGLGGDDVIDGAGGNDTLSDGAGNDVLRGGAGNDAIYFTTGAEPSGSDVAAGGSGDDVYYVSLDSGTDRITGLDENDSGVDRLVLSGITFSMLQDYEAAGSNLYLFIGGSTGVIENTIILEGFLQYTAPSHRIEFAGGTTLTKADFAPNYWYGTSGDDVNGGSFVPDNLEGGSGNDTLSGGMGNDTIRGGEGNDILHGNTGDDILEDGTGNDMVYGDEGDDLIRAYRNIETDQFIGGTGNDTYEFMSQSDTTYYEMYNSSEVTELAGEGTDTVVTNYYNFTLSSTSVEKLVVKMLNYHWFSNNYAISYDRKIFGNDLDNTITINGLSSQNAGWRIVVDGGLGNDTLIGSVGDEVYVLDSVGDVVIEPESSTSMDIVRASFSYSLVGRIGIEGIELTTNETTATGDSRNNQLDGSMATGVNTLIGGAGDDTYLIGSNDIVVEQADGGTDTVMIKKFALGNLFTVPSGTNHIEVYRLHEDAGNGGLLGGDGDDILIGNRRSNGLSGGAGNDVLRSGGADYTDWDSLNGGEGDDLLISEGGNRVSLTGGHGNDELQVGTWATESVNYDRGDGVDLITMSSSGTGSGIGTVWFGSSIDADNVIWTRDGNDLLVTFSDSVGDKVIVKDYWRQEEGVDVLTSVVDQFSFNGESSYRSGITLEALRNKPPTRNYSMLDANGPTGQPWTFTLPVDAFADETPESLVYSVDGLPSWLTFDPQTRTFQGTPPMGQSDQYYQVIATDMYGASEYLTLHFSFVNLIQGTSGNDTLVGTGGIDTLIGLAGNDNLNGGAGADRLIGGAGNDSYVVDNADDEITEAHGEGDDLVNSSVSYWLSENVERLTMTGSAIEGEGNELDNIITGNGSGNSLYGNEGNDTLLGNSGNDSLYGGSGNDLLDGGSGNDYMSGEEGDDTYVVGSAGDEVEEWESSGTDTVKASVSYTLGFEVENLILTGSSGLSGNGNELGNVLTGNSGANTLRGYAGHDRLDGGSGNDTMLGGAGDDTYVVGSTGDVVTELAGEGVDQVESSVTFTLGNNAENLTLTGSAAINGTGNSLNNVIRGNSANNTLNGGSGNDTLDGGAGNDTMVGGTGDDTYAVNTTSDVVTEQSNQGSDTVMSAVSYTLGSNLEHLVLTGSAAINGTGNAGNNRMSGNAGNNSLSASGGDDVLEGGAGTDTLSGGAGKDTYVMARGHGSDTVVENDVASGQLDVASFASGIAHDQLWFARPGGSNNLEISIIGTADKLVIKDWYLGNQYRVEEIQTLDGGMKLTAAKVQDLVVAMAGLAKPALGQTILPNEYQLQLAPVFASCWTSNGQGLIAGAVQDAPATVRMLSSAPSEARGVEAIMPGGCVPAPRQDRVEEWLARIGERGGAGRFEAWLAEHGYASLQDWLDTHPQGDRPFGGLLGRFRDPRILDPAPISAVGDASAPQAPPSIDSWAAQDWMSRVDPFDRMPASEGMPAPGTTTLPQDPLDLVYRDLLEASTERADPWPETGHAQALAETASKVQRLISAMALAPAGSGPLAANCEFSRDPIVESHVM